MAIPLYLCLHFPVSSHRKHAIRLHICPFPAARQHSSYSARFNWAPFSWFYPNCESELLVNCIHTEGKIILQASLSGTWSKLGSTVFCFPTSAIGIFLLPRASFLVRGFAITYGQSWIQGLSGFLLSRLIDAQTFDNSVLRFRSAFLISKRNSSSSASYTLLNGDGLTWLFILSHILYLSNSHNIIPSYWERKRKGCMPPPLTTKLTGKRNTRWNSQCP
jgi:hypothetical protein